jgi:hypothetical protein
MRCEKMELLNVEKPFNATSEMTEMHSRFHVGLKTAFNSFLEQQTYSPMYVA